MIFYLLLFYLYEMMDVHSTYCGNHFTRYINQIFMPHTLTLYSQCSISILSQNGGGEILRKKWASFQVPTE